MTPLPRPGPDEAAPYYFRYIDLVPDGDIVATLRSQAASALDRFSRITEDRSLVRYAPDKWSVRQLLNHINDAERLFQARAYWFARGFDTPLPSFDQEVAVAAARADERSWAAHRDEFRTVRAATISFFENLPAAAWDGRGIASGYPFSVRALAFLAAGHLIHHSAVLERAYHL